MGRTDRRGGVRRAWLRRAARGLAVAAVTAAAGPALAGPPTVKHFDPPGPTSWRPAGCRAVPTGNPIIGPRDRWKLLHGDVLNGDEVGIALAPAFEADWHAEPDTFNVAGVTFDHAGNLYFTPFLPHEDVVLISLSPVTGARRWAIPGTGAPQGAVAPMILADPDHPSQEIVYVALYDRAVAVRTDGTLVWDVPTGLTLDPTLSHAAVPGINYLATLDAVVASSSDGHVYVLDRRTGAQVLSAPYVLPGSPSPAGSLALPQALVDAVQAELAPLVAFPPGSTFSGFLQAILGNGIEGLQLLLRRSDHRPHLDHRHRARRRRRHGGRVEQLRRALRPRRGPDGRGARDHRGLLGLLRRRIRQHAGAPGRRQPGVHRRQPPEPARHRPHVQAGLVAAPGQPDRGRRRRLVGQPRALRRHPDRHLPGPRSWSDGGARVEGRSRRLPAGGRHAAELQPAAREHRRQRDRLQRGGRRPARGHGHDRFPADRRVRGPRPGHGPDPLPSPTASTRASPSSTSVRTALTTARSTRPSGVAVRRGCSSLAGDTPPLQGGIRKFAPRAEGLLVRDAVCAADDRRDNALAQAAV